MTTLQNISLTQDDINIITYALRKLAKDTGLLALKEDAENLINYIKEENKNNNHANND